MNCITDAIKFTKRSKKINCKKENMRRRTDAEAEPVTVVIVRAVVIGCGEVDELGRFDLLVEVISAVGLNLIHFSCESKERSV